MNMDRRAFLSGSAALGAVLAMPGLAETQEISLPPQPSRYPDDAWVVLDPRFSRYMIGNTPLQRQWTGALWAEGPAWNGVGRYAVFSDIPNNRQMRWDAVTETVTPLRHVSNFSNGNTFDFEGRQISCEHSTARVVRYGREGSPTVLAETFEGKPLNAPNDAVVHPDDGGIIFTDPGYGSHWYYEGNVRELELPTSIYHIDATSGVLTKLTDEIFKPNGLCFSPDYRILYVADSAATHHPEPARIIAWDVEENGRKLTNRREFATLESGFHDGLRADVDGNVWAATGFAGEGQDGVQVYAPDGTKIGQIKTPEGCANLTFVGEQRNRLFMTASQSIYTIYTATQGAHIA
ncbi:MAG TPA: SMP-30/gluconolactonase/LRE family protein [Aurantimonas coralicida]|uniref:SMP-30/Gluconolactonase/LRE-like region domain-containing protein n=2 Tax=root TaxID=1 RepID=A0A0F9TMP2_9ZZZZ|nr:SMP-30/gluconolactonase/LRE family protein [Aurantimonas coralicida]